MQKSYYNHPLGGGKTFHSHLSHASDDRETTKQLKDIRNTLLMRGTDQVSVGVGHFNSNNKNLNVRIEKNAIQLNNANQASMFRGVPCRVRSGAFLSLGNRTKSKVTSIRATKCHRWEVDSELAHSCDVLGPYACADCMRERMRKQVYDEADRTFPGLEVSERDLCIALHMRGDANTLPDDKQKLPPIMENGYMSQTPSSHKGRFQTPARTPNTNSGVRRRSRKLAPLQRYPNTSGGLNAHKMLPITNAELQKRVLDKKLTREATSSTNTLFTPRGIIEETTEPSLAPTPRIRVDIQIPMVTRSREISKTSSN